jgi:hypothetical protein
MEISRLARQ